MPITPEGYPFIGAFALVSLILFWIWSPLGWLGTLATLWCAYFFRDPPRVTPVRDGLVVAPADGRISQITTAPPPHELGLGDKPLPRISIFMSVFDCHVNRSPVTGRVEKILYQPGKFFNADLDKASVDNERNSLVIAIPGGRIAVVQIAGLIARRIVCFVQGRPAGRRRRAFRHDPFRLAPRRLSAGRHAAAGGDRADLAGRRNRARRPARRGRGEGLPGGLIRPVGSASYFIAKLLRIGLSAASAKMPVNASSVTMMANTGIQLPAVSCSSAASGPPSTEPTPCAI